ncbi:hypothetical protein ACFLSJ_01845 [Verrucomicrobiota bacterium]
MKAHYPVSRRASDHLLLGFSKSGIGAFSLLLRNPTEIGLAAAWDAPFMNRSHTAFGADAVYGTEENFRRHTVPELLERRAIDLQAGPARLVLRGYGMNHDSTAALHEHMERLRIPHVYRNTEQAEHHWHSGWVTPTLQDLLALHAGKTLERIGEAIC